MKWEVYSLILQIATENIEGLPTEEQIAQWATAAVQPEGDEVENDLGSYCG